LKGRALGNEATSTRTNWKIYGGKKSLQKENKGIWKSKKRERPPDKREKRLQLFPANQRSSEKKGNTSIQVRNLGK